MKAGIKQAVASAAVFAAILLALISVDDRVRERFNDLLSEQSGLASWQVRASDLGNALASAARHQSVENAPLLIFGTVGAVLVAFMLRT